MKKLMAGLLIGLGSLSIESSSAMDKNTQIEANKVNNQTVISVKKTDRDDRSTRRRFWQLYISGQIVWDDGRFLNKWTEPVKRELASMEDMLSSMPPSVKSTREPNLICTAVWNENAKFFIDICEKINRIIASEPVMDKKCREWNYRFMYCVNIEVLNTISSTEYSLAFEDNRKGFGKMTLRVGGNEVTMLVIDENASDDSSYSCYLFGTWCFDSDYSIVY